MRLCIGTDSVIVNTSLASVPTTAHSITIIVDGTAVASPVPMVLPLLSCVDVSAADLAVQMSAPTNTSTGISGTLIF